MAVTVINVLPNGHLLVAGERSMGLNGGVSTLRFSGIVNPRDIGPGNVVASADVVNANLERRPGRCVERRLPQLAAARAGAQPVHLVTSSALHGAGRRSSADRAAR